MGFYDAFKDAISLAQKADNIELYRKLLELSHQALDMQNEISQLKEENAKLKNISILESEIEYYEDPFVTRKNDQKPIKYCAACWVDKRKLVPLQDNANDNYFCPLCKAHVIDMRNWSHRKQS